MVYDCCSSRCLNGSQLIRSDMDVVSPWHSDCYWYYYCCYFASVISITIIIRISIIVITILVIFIFCCY